MKRISDIISGEQIRGWKDGSVITIKAGTGRGKSYFVKNELYECAKNEGKKILMLIHRVNCVNQFKQEIHRDNKDDIIDIMTYQSLDYMHSIGETFDFSGYEYIVCDEFHYFMSDAAFNRTTDISLNAILGQTDCIRIFMSATGDYMDRYIKNFKSVSAISYELDINYDFVHELKFFHNDEAMVALMKDFIDRGEKAIFFVQKATKAYKLHMKFKDNSIFNCGESDKHYRYVDKEKMSTILADEGFAENILITTSAFDAGVNITTKKHKGVSHIVVDIEDEGVLIQCLGRRRIDNAIDNDGVVVYIKNINNNRLGGMQVQINERIKKADCFRDHGNVAYTKKYGRSPDRHAIVYEEVNEDETGTVKKLNELMYYKSLINLANVQLMIRDGYMSYISSLLGKKYTIMEEMAEKDSLECYLDSIVGEVMLTLKDRKELIDRLDVKSNGSQLKSINSLNAAIKENQLGYLIDAFETSRTIDGKRKKYKSAWRVLRLVDK